MQKHYAALFESTPELTTSRGGNLVFTGDADDPATSETLLKLGFKNASTAIATIKGWHYGRYPAMKSARARENLTEFTPALLEALGHTGDPDLALSTFDKFLSEVPTALQLFAMLRANPNLLQLVAQIMGSRPGWRGSSPGAGASWMLSSTRAIWATSPPMRTCAGTSGRRSWMLALMRTASIARALWARSRCS